MAAPASLLGDHHDPVPRARHRAADEEQVALGVHLDDPEPQLGVPRRAVVARHLLALDDARRVGAGADRARLPVPRVAVAGRAAAEAVPLHDALEPAALGRAGHLDQLARGEDPDRHLGARRRGGVPRHPEVAEHLRRRLEPRRLRVAQLRLRRPDGALGAEPELHRAGLHLHHPAGARLDDGHRGDRAVFREHPGHPELAADESRGHRYWTLISTSTPAGRSSLVRASIVWGRESSMSSSRLWVRSSNCSRLFLSTCGLRSTVHRSILVGSGIGPVTVAPVLTAVRTMSAAAVSSTTWSNAFRRMRMRWAIVCPYARILVTTPAPTVRPLSRIAKRSPSSAAIGVISSIVIWMLSPGITISTPAGSSTDPVTSVVRK